MTQTLSVNTEIPWECSIMSEVEIDATLMNKWLGDKKVFDLSPKTLYDIQTLIEYYRDVIVPDKKVTVSFPVNGTPHADTDNEEVFIPYHMLKEGRVDDTIGAMIHELHHIKLSPSARYIKNVAFKFLK